MLDHYNIIGMSLHSVVYMQKGYMVNNFVNIWHELQA